MREKLSISGPFLKGIPRMAKETARSRPTGRVLPDPKSGPDSETPNTNSAPNAEQVSRLSVPFDADKGEIDFSSMRPSTVEKLKKAVAAPNARAALGLDGSGSAAPAADGALNALVVNVVYDALGSAAVIFAKTRGFQATHAEVLRYTAEEKAMFAPITIEVLEEYDLIKGKHAKLITLLAAVGAVTSKHIAELMQLSNGTPATAARPTGDAAVLQ